jgi:general secretion pathway protein H
MIRSAALGFSLLELLVVLALLALSAALVVPQFSGVVQTGELKAAVRQLAATLRSARGMAVGEQRETSVLLDVAQKRYQVAGREREYVLPDKLNLEFTTASTELLNAQQAGVKFFPDGTSTGGQIILDSGLRRFVIDVLWLTGRIVVSEES